MECVCLVDGYSIVYRSYFAMLRSPLLSPEGKNTSAVHGFFRSLFQLLRLREPSHLAVVMDSRTPTFRHRRYPEYKANREKTPDDLHAQIPIIEEILQALGVPFLRVDGFEADDILATIALMCREHGMPCLILSGDKDMLQVVGDCVTVLHPQKGAQGFDEWGSGEVFAARGVYPTQIVDYLTLTGDQSDNVPGVPGIGEKTACKLLAEYGDLDSIYRRIDEVAPPGVKSKLIAGRDNAMLSSELVTLRTDVPLSVALPHLKLEKLRADRAVPLFAREGMKTIVEDLGGSMEPELPFESVEPGTYALVTDIEALDRWISDIRSHGTFAFDVETDSLEEMEAKPIGFSLAVDDGRACYVPLRTRGVRCVAEDDARVRLCALLGDQSLRMIGQNVKYDYKVLARWGVHMRNSHFDTMVAAWVLDSELSSYGLDSLAERFLNYRTIRYEEVAVAGTLDGVDLERVTDYAAEDADITFRLFRLFSAQLREEGLEDVFYTVEMPLVPILAEMELTGIRILPERLQRYDRDLQRELSAIEEEIFGLCGRSFNINSTKQLQAVLFEERGLTPVKRTKTGYSTDTSVLEVLVEQAEHDPVPKMVLRHRVLSKLRSTYVTSLPLLVSAETGRLHTHFVQTGTATGRLSSKNPNLQNIPVREEEGRKIREAFVPDHGCVFLSADYSQIELAILAYLSEDRTLLRTFSEGGDVHSLTASFIFGVPEYQVAPEQRRVGKTINFGVIYGMSAFRLSRDLKISRADADRFIHRYFERYSGVDAFIKNTTRSAEETGWVETIMGRKRRLRGITSKNRTERMAAGRMAVNSPIQGSAADIVKAAMIRVTRDLVESGSRAKLLLQVHDELIFEVPEREIAAVTKVVKTAMETAVDFKIPLQVKVRTGDCWGAL